MPQECVNLVVTVPTLVFLAPARKPENTQGDLLLPRQGRSKR